ncbi:hypothetical protein [Acinetobacter sp. 3657]|uniref:hypothetical protein n=1 Tax=Acinetobacter sp. 3657 TaxID=2817764 RepID=UPI0028553247|nr:hypothetical protein [Prolinoborus sp. 3657]
MKKIFWILFLSITSSLANAFTIYTFVPFRYHIDQNGKKVDGYAKAEQALLATGTKPIKVLYEKYFLTDGKPDIEKMKKVVADTKLNPEIPVSFDIEIGNDRKPETVLPVVLESLRLYHRLGGAAEVGVYSLLPVSTEGELYTGKRLEGYQKLNQKYEPIAELVDFISPVIYNYNIRNINIWKSIADVNMKESHKYAKKYNLKIYPYITASYYLSKKNPITRMRLVELLSDKEMKDRLDYLKSKSADGVILWESSNTVENDGEQPVVDLRKGWAKGVINFNLYNK